MTLVLGNWALCICSKCRPRSACAVWTVWLDWIFVLKRTLYKNVHKCKVASLISLCRLRWLIGDHTLLWCIKPSFPRAKLKHQSWWCLSLPGSASLATMRPPSLWHLLPSRGPTIWRKKTWFLSYRYAVLTWLVSIIVAIFSLPELRVLLDSTFMIYQLRSKWLGSVDKNGCRQTYGPIFMKLGQTISSNDISVEFEKGTGFLKNMATMMRGSVP